MCVPNQVGPVNLFPIRFNGTSSSLSVSPILSKDLDADFGQTFTNSLLILGSCSSARRWIAKTHSFRLFCKKLIFRYLPGRAATSYDSCANRCDCCARLSWACSQEPSGQAAGGWQYWLQMHQCTMCLSPLKRCIKEFWQNVSFCSHFPAV